MLLAVCNGNYEFTLVDVGDAGRQSNGGVYKCSNLGFAIDNNLLNIPKPDVLDNSINSKTYPYVFVADDALQLQTYMLKPYAQQTNDNNVESVNNATSYVLFFRKM